MCLLNCGDKIRKYRKMLKISQKEAAGNKVSHSMISLIECGKANLNTVTAILIADNLNNIAQKKGIDLNISLKDFYASDSENNIIESNKINFENLKEDEIVNSKNSKK